MAANQMREKVYTELSRITHAISNPKRLELVDLLAQRPFSVDELSREISMTIASTSQHLQVLKRAKLVNTSRKGNFIIYSISEDKVVKLVSAVKDLGFRKYAEIERLIADFKTDKNVLESITLNDLLARSKKEKLFLIDVRPEGEFEAGHIPTAVSIPLDQLKKRINELPKNKTIVAYCRGPLCVMAVDAVNFLKARKFKALRMEDGFVEWKLLNAD
ncbi:MAG: metalloregulator ArsR/SmtB family transcription factor [Bacteroidetes bacterium]|nr:metalloregulator ArsR/SmtB family transcription factor [Bacteroidota bacterium]